MTSKQFESRFHSLMNNKALTDEVRQRKLEALFTAKRNADKANAQGHQIVARYPVQSSGKMRHDRLVASGHFDYYRR